MARLAGGLVDGVRMRNGAWMVQDGSVTAWRDFGAFSGTVEDIADLLTGKRLNAAFAHSLHVIPIGSAETKLRTYPV